MIRLETKGYPKAKNGGKDMTQEFKEKPFNRIYNILEGLEALGPQKETGLERLDEEESRCKTIRDSMNYVEQARRFLKGAKIYGSGEAYQLADDSIDDLQQNLQILTAAYPEKLKDVTEYIPRIWEEKRKVYDSISIDPEGIKDREYNKVLLDIRNQGVLESSQENNSVVVDNPHHT